MATWGPDGITVSYAEGERPRIEYYLPKDGTSVTAYLSGGYTGVSANNGGKPVASKDDVVKALYRLNPTLNDEFETEDEFVEALIAAGQKAHQEYSQSRLSTFSIIEK